MPGIAADGLCRATRHTHRTALLRSWATSGRHSIAGCVFVSHGWDGHVGLVALVCYSRQMWAGAQKLSHHADRDLGSARTPRMDCVFTGGNSGPGRTTSVTQIVNSASHDQSLVVPAAECVRT